MTAQAAIDLGIERRARENYEADARWLNNCPPWQTLSEHFKAMYRADASYQIQVESRQLREKCCGKSFPTIALQARHRRLHENEEPEKLGAPIESAGALVL